MKISTFTLSGLLAVPLLLVNCDPGSDEGTGTTTDETTTTEDPTTTTEDPTTTSAEGSTTGPPGPSCLDPQEVPMGPPVDCSGADVVIDTSVIIEEGGDDPSILENVVRVEGSIRINRIDAADLNFMACVQEVTGDVTIFGNDNLTNVDGLWSLTSIGTDFVFSENNAITDFNGLPNVATLERNLIMKNNAAMTTISGFHSLVGINAGNLTIQANDVLNNIDGLGGLAVINGVLAITANPMLCISSVNCVGSGIVQPAVPPESWSTQGNDEGC